MFDNTAIAERPRMASWNNYTHTTGVVSRFTGPTFPVPTTVVKSKGQTLKLSKYPPYSDRGPKANPGGDVK